MAITCNAGNNDRKIMSKTAFVERCFKDFPFSIVDTCSHIITFIKKLLDILLPFHLSK